MNKSNYLLLFCILLLSGCSVNYNLDITSSDRFYEEVTMSANNSSDVTKITEFNQNIPIDKDADDQSVFNNKIDGIRYYRQQKLDSNNRLVFSYNHNFDSFNNAMFAFKSYQYVTVMKNDNELILSTSKSNLAFDRYDNLDEVTVTVTSKYKLKETNADVVEKHKYKWIITRENAKDKYLYLSLDTTERDLTFWEKLIEGEYTNMFTISLLLFVIGIVIYLFLKKKGERRDKI